MLLESEADLIALLGVVAALLLLLSLVGGVIAALKTFQVRQFQDLLFKAERKIDTLERRMFNVLNAVPVALVETDITGKFTFANKAAHQLLGRKDSELIGLRFHSATWGITFPDGRPVPGDLMPIARSLRGHTVKGFQHMLTNYGGKDKVLVSVTSMPIMNSMAEVIGTTSAMVEIETLSGEGVDDLTGAWRGHWFSAATVPFWGLDAQGTVLDVNPAALDAFDLTREDVVGKNWAQLFISDGHFQAALDYLGAIQDDSDTHDASVNLRLKASGGEAACSVTGWVVRTHEGGPVGLTLMALPAPDVVATPAPEPVTITVLDEAALQELEDFRSGEKALAALGIGVWQYDPEADTIVEDEGMRRLIGRETPGGPTLIAPDDQMRADEAFSRLKSGEDALMQLDMRVAGDRWITLKGQSTLEDGERQIYGIAYDSTEWKQAVAIEPETSLSQAELDAAVDAAAETARQEGYQAGRAEALSEFGAELRAEFRAELEAEFETRLEAARREAARQATAVPAGEDDVYAWVNIRNEAAAPDPALVAENSALKDQIEALATELAMLHNAPASEPVVVREPDPTVVEANEVLKAQLAVLEGELEALRSRPEPEARVERVIEADPAVVAENETLKAQLADLTAEAEAVAAARDAIQDELDAVLAQPVPEPDFSPYDARIAELQAGLDAARDRYDDLAQRYHVLSNAPDPEPDYSEHEARIAALQSALNDLRSESEALNTALAARPEPNYAPYEARIANLTDELHEVRDAHEVLKGLYAQLAATPAPDISGYEQRLAAANNELAKWQAAHRDLQGRLDELSQALNQSNTQVAGMQARIDQMNAALSNAQRFETVGRLTGDVAQDFAQMLQVVNGALDVMARTSDSPENVRKLAEAALAAGKRGERLTRQLQAFQSGEF